MKVLQLLLTVKHLQSVEKVNVVVEPAVHHRLSIMGECSGVYTFTPDQGKRLGEFIDFVVCLGGDGVLLHTALLFGDNVPPVIAFHLGSLGFMSQHNYDNMKSDISGVIHGHAPLNNCKVSGDCENSTGVFVSLRMRLLCELTRKGKLGIEQTHEVRAKLSDPCPQLFLSLITLSSYQLLLGLALNKCSLASSRQCFLFQN